MLNSSGKSLIVRYPLVPSINTAPSDLKALAEFLQSLDSRVEVNLLPYHRLGEHKYRSLGRGDDVPNINPPERSEVEAALNLLKAANISARCS
jgi:pyruvate formate lyase activating enzyme